MGKRDEIPADERIWPTWKEIKECARETKRVLREEMNKGK